MHLLRCRRKVASCHAISADQGRPSRASSASTGILWVQRGFIRVGRGVRAGVARIATSLLVKRRSVWIARSSRGTSLVRVCSCTSLVVLTMQHWAIAVSIPLFVQYGRRGFDPARHWLPRPVTNPRPLLLTRVLDVEQSYRLAVSLKFIFDFSAHRQWVGTRQIYIAILKRRAVIYRDGNEPARFRLAFFPCPLENPNRANSTVSLDFLPTWPGY